jgi:uncharacterized membrane protein
LKNNFLDTFTLFLKQLNVPVTETSALEFLETHPDEGSMLAYADAFNHFKIENAAIRIKQEDLITLPTPFIAFSQIHGGTFSVVKNLTANTIEWYDTQKGWVKDKLEDFTKTWSGVVLLAETDEKSGEKNYTAKRQNEILSNIRIPLAVTLIALIFLYFIINAPLLSPSTYILLGLKIIGMVISTLLFVKSIDNANSLVNKLCNAGSKISCQSILDSPAAKMTPWFSWSDAGFIYFFGSFFGLLISIEKPGYLSTYWTLQLFFSFLALLFSSYSLYYQAIKAKMWCTLCLGVVSVFFLESLLTFTSINDPNKFVLQGILNVAIGFLLPIAFLILYKTTAIKAIESKSLKRELTKLKSNPQIFEVLMAGQRQMPEIPADMPIITIGNKNADHTIFMISNPLCTPCAEYHTRLEKFIANSNGSFNSKIIFISSMEDNDPGGKFVRKLFKLPCHLQEDAISSWYSRNDRNFDVWNLPFVEFIDSQTEKNAQNRNLQWTKDAGIFATPTVLFNGKILPFSFKIEDLIYQFNSSN